MREYVLTDEERRIAETYLKTGKKEAHFDTLKVRMKRNAPKLREELKLIFEVLEREGVELLERKTPKKRRDG